MKDRSGQPVPDHQPGPEGRIGQRARQWAARFLALLGVSLLSLLHRSWKTEVAGLDRLENLLRSGRRVLVVFWHGKYIPFFTIFRGRGACIFTSQSFRGEIICGICRHFAHHCLTIPDHGGEGTLSLLRKALEGRQLAAIVPDGPRGPYHRVKPGVIRLAADIGLTLLPASVAAHPCLVLMRRWDRMEIPLPFSRVRLNIGMPVVIPGDLGGHSIGWWEEHLGEALETAGEQAEAGLEGTGMD